MKQYWLKLEARIDAMNLRERAMVFAIASLLLITLVNTLLLDPLHAQQTELSKKVRHEQQQIAAMQAEIQARVKSHDADPNAPMRERLRILKQQAAQMQGDLRGMQKGLVSPDKMAGLLEDLLRGNGRLRLVSLKTLPVLTLNEPIPMDTKPAGTKGTVVASGGEKVDTRQGGADIVYKHAVEIVVQGGYADLTAYLSQVEALPWQLFWANAKLNADTYPKASLTLTLFTLSLDRKWLNI